MKAVHVLFVLGYSLLLGACGGNDLETPMDSSGSSSRAPVIASPSSMSSDSSLSSNVNQPSSERSSVSTSEPSSQSPQNPSSQASSLSSIANSLEMIYNGESHPFAAASTWDSNGSTLVNSTASPASGSDHLRANLNVVNWWGAVAYLPGDWSPQDWSDGETLHFRAKADVDTNLAVLLYDSDNNQSATSVILSLSTAYAEYSLDLETLGDGVSLDAIHAIVFASSGMSAGNRVVDIDDIAIVRDDSPVVPTPVPTPINWNTEVDPVNPSIEGKKFRGVYVVDKDYLMVHFVDGEVDITEHTTGDCAYKHCSKTEDNTVVPFGEPLNTEAATSTWQWHITSIDDEAYGSTGESPDACHRKSKLNGMAQMEWVTNDFRYDHTMEHWVYLKLPTSMVPGKTYSIQIGADTNTDIDHWTFAYDIFNNRSEAVHVNLAGYHPQAAIQAADLYIWMGDGGARDYTGYEGNNVYLYNVNTKASQHVGQVSFGQASAQEAQWYNFTRSSVWHADFSGNYSPGTYRLAIDGVGASSDFDIGESALTEPFRVSMLGYFYMRIGQDNLDMTPVPRRPLWIPGQHPTTDTKIVITNMDPYHPDWGDNGDRWDQPAFFAQYVKADAPENPNAIGGHSDALDWDRHLGHVSNIYDMLLPYILTDGAIGSDAIGIAESGNGTPDIIDEARNEVDFWLSLRYNGGYAHGLTNPDSDTHILYQADNTAIAAWANAVNAAMLAEAYRIDGDSDRMNQYLEAAVEAWNHASGLSDQMLDQSQGLGSGEVPGRDFRITAAAWLYTLTGDTRYEDVINAETLVTSGTAEFMTNSRNQLYAMAAYLRTDRVVHYPTLQNNMRAAVIYQAKNKETRYMSSRPSRRSTDNDQGYFHTAQFVLRSILAHSVATDAVDREHFEQAMLLEADWGLGRNPANMIQMTTATTSLAYQRSVDYCYTSGWNDGSPGVHPGHTPYLNIDDWGDMIMAKPSWMTSKLYPKVSGWPRGEIYFNTRYVWAHSEFTPRQTMRGKMALYGYLLGIKQ